MVNGFCQLYLCYNTRMRSNYEKSNAVLAIDFPVTRRARLVTKHLLRSRSAAARNELGEELLDELCDCARIDIINLKISDTRQYHKKRGGRTVFKQYGYYRPSSKYIYITNRTAVRGQILAPKTFLITLLHEWMHHYDYCKLKLNSIHTSGFYYRLGSLEHALGA